MASSSGRTERSTKANGLEIRPMAKDSSGMRMAMSTLGSGVMIRLMDMEFTHMSTELNMKETGLMTCKKAWESKCGLMGQPIKVTIKLA